MITGNINGDKSKPIRIFFPKKLDLLNPIAAIVPMIVAIILDEKPKYKLFIVEVKNSGSLK